MTARKPPAILPGITGHYSVAQGNRTGGFWSYLWESLKRSPRYDTKAQAVDWATERGGVYLHDWTM